MQEYEVIYHKIISANIKRFRRAAQLSQENLAEKLGCSQEFISRVENNRERISLRMLLHLSKIFDDSPTVFFKKL